MSSLFICTMQAVTAMVQQAMQYIDETPDLETRIELIKMLNSVSAGKVSSDVMFFWVIWCNLSIGVVFWLNKLFPSLDLC